MADVVPLKDQMIGRLWLPQAKEAGRLLYPRRRKNAQMRMLTLSDGINLNEILQLEQEHLLRREDSVAWVSSMLKRSRVEAENVGVVLDGPAYESTFLGPACPLARRFPFDIVNLDFASQEAGVLPERTAREIETLERAVGLQERAAQDKFLLIFTVPICSARLDVRAIARRSDQNRVDGWEGLQVDGFPEEITDPDEKSAFIRAVVTHLIRKYGYCCSNGTETLSCSDAHTDLLSIAGVLVR
jgi:hypothetical protein